MLSVYTNQRDLLNATSTTEVSRIESIDRQLLDIRNFSVTFKDNYRPNLELHVYTPDGIYLTGNHNTLFTIEDNNNQRSVSPRDRSRVNFQEDLITEVSIQEDSIAVAYKHLALDTVKELETLGINKGQYKLVYNLFDNVLGGFDSQKVFIKEISPSRRELRLQLSDNESLTLTTQLQALRDRWSDLLSNDVFDSFVLNFGFNETYQIINFRFEIDNSTTPEIFIKLYGPLPARHGEKSKVFISEEITTPFLDSVSIVPKYIPEPVTTLAGPNFDLEQYEGGSVATSFRSWNDLLAVSASTSQQIIDNYFSGSLSGIKLNINYRYFDNFVHYGSAVERVKNFKYKLELIEYYTQQVRVILDIVNPGPTINANLTDLYSKRNKVVSTFDDFEKYLFFESNESKLYSFDDAITSYGVTSSIAPWPKNSLPFNSTYTDSTWLEAYELWSAATAHWDPDPYGYFAIQEFVNSEVAQNYYNGLLEIATIYDRYNVHKLQNTIPAHIQNSEDGESYVLFINMMSQHFDILWTYIKNLTSIHTREEHPKDGMSNDLLHHVASSMGFNLLNGKSASELWRYSLGVDQNGVALQSGINGIASISDQNNTKEIWRRLVNNLPYILKSKGTSRSIKALLSCFGIPSTVLTIKEYGGPTTFTDNDHFPEYVHDVYHYAWKSDTDSVGSISIPIRLYKTNSSNNIPVNTLEFRFKLDPNYNYGLGTYYNIATISGSNWYNIALTKDSNDDNEGTLTLFNTVTGTAVSASNLEIFDNSWHSIIVQEQDNISTLKVAKTLYGKKIYIKSSSFASSESVFPKLVMGQPQSGSIEFGMSHSLSPAVTLPNGNTVSSLNKVNGYIHEIRLWSGSLNDDAIIEHATSPATYTYNVDRYNLSNGSEAGKPYDHLLQRFTLSDATILSGSFYQPSVHPNQTINTGSLYFIGYTNSGSIKFKGFEETYYTPSPSLGGSSLYTNKVRIESSSIDSNKRLNTRTRVEKSSYDRYSLDSNRLGVYFSPQTAISEDVFNQLGYFEIDDYIGNPGDVYNDQYTDLNNFAIQYWKKYNNRNDFESYFRALEIYDFTLFRYIKQLLPHRANVITGLVIEPTVLERNKVKLLNKPVIEDLVKNAVINDIQPGLTSEYSLINANIEDVQPGLTSEYSLINANIYSLIPEIESNFDNTRIGEITYPTEISSSIDIFRFVNEPGFPIIPTITSNFDNTRIAEITYAREITSTIDDFSGLIQNAINVDRLGTAWVQNRYIGRYRLTESGSYYPTPRITAPYGNSNRIILNSIPSTYLLTLDQRFYSTAASASVDNAYSSSLKFADIHLSQAAGWNNSRYNGSKLTGPGINIDSPSTVDGGPVVKVKRVSPNQIVFSNNQITTVDQSTTGVRSRTL